MDATLVHKPVDGLSLSLAPFYKPSWPFAPHRGLQPRAHAPRLSAGHGADVASVIYPGLSARQGGPLAGQVRMAACGGPEPLRRLLLRRLPTARLAQPGL